MDFKTKYMIGLEERISLTEKLTNLQAQLKQQEAINNDLLKHINSLEKFKCPNCSQHSTGNCSKTPVYNSIMPLDKDKDGKELDLQQVCEPLQLPLMASKSTPKPAASEAVPQNVESQPTFSGKRPFNYAEFSMLNSALSSDSESDSPGEKSDQEQIYLDDDTLVPWTDIVRQNHPKLLNAGNQSSWEKYVLEFLGMSLCAKRALVAGN
jgi:hypothetical protein